MLMPKALNQLPIDGNWMRCVDRLTNEAAAELDCAVVLVALQEDGKMLICDAGGTGKVREALDTSPGSSFFYALGRACMMAEALEDIEQKKEPKN